MEPLGGRLTIFIKKDLLSFDVTRIMQNNVGLYHSALRHILTTDKLPITVLEELDGSENLGNMMINDHPDAECETYGDEGRLTHTQFIPFLYFDAVAATHQNDAVTAKHQSDV